MQNEFRKVDGLVLALPGQELEGFFFHLDFEET